MRARLFFVLPLALVALTACDDQSSNSAAAPSAPPPPAVDAAAPLAKEIIEWDEFNGRFHASQDVEIRPRVSGYVEAVHFRDGQMVQTGDLLFSIDKRPFEAAKSRAVAELASARARYQFANQEVERGQQLVTRGTLPKATLEQRISDRLVASADIAAAEADLRSAQLDIEFAEVRAPISGRISDSRVDVGNLVSGSGTTTLLTKIVALDPIHFEFDMSETEYLSYERANRRGDLKSTRDGPTRGGLISSIVPLTRVPARSGCGRHCRTMTGFYCPVSLAGCGFRGHPFMKPFWYLNPQSFPTSHGSLS